VLVGVAVRALWRRNQLEAIAVAGLVAIFAMPMASSDLRVAQSAKPQPGFWQDAQLEAAAWIKANGPAGVYGSTDAGVLGFTLDPRPVVDLDGLVNSYSYGEQLVHHVPAVDRYKSQGVTVLVGRLVPGGPDVPACARVLWTSPDAIVYGGSADQPQVTRVPLRIFDLNGCSG